MHVQSLTKYSILTTGTYTVLSVNKINRSKFSNFKNCLNSIYLVSMVNSWSVWKMINGQLINIQLRTNMQIFQAFYWLTSFSWTIIIFLHCTISKNFQCWVATDSMFTTYIFSFPNTVNLVHKKPQLIKICSCCSSDNWLQNSGFINF